MDHYIIEQLALIKKKNPEKYIDLLNMVRSAATEAKEDSNVEKKMDAG